MRLTLILSVISGLAGCSSPAPGPLSIKMYNPNTQQTLDCSARDMSARADKSVLAGAVENCAKNLEARGFVRQQ